MIASSKSESDSEFTVCDPFTGSGSAAIAALKQGANFIGCDISKKAVELCQKRLSAYALNKIDIYQSKPAVDPKLNILFNEDKIK